MQKNITTEHEQSSEPLTSDNSLSSIKEQPIVFSTPSQEHVSSEKIDVIRENIVGFNTRYTSPFNI